jgi:hypothetical protein
MPHSLPKIKDMITKDIEKTGEIPPRHTRHFATFREDLPDENWSELTEWAHTTHDIDLNDIADRGIEHKNKHLPNN